MASTQEQRIVDHILDAISDQRLRAGTKLGEQALSDLFSCNRAHVRRALATLTAFKVVDHQPNRGAFVATPTEAEARDVFQARRAVESTIARNVVKLATDEDITELRAHLAEEQKLPDRANRPEAIRLSRQFHLLLGRLGRNKVLEQYLTELTMRTSLIIGLYGKRQGPTCADDEHEQIVDAIAARDTDKALRLLDQHLRHVEKGIEFTEAPSQLGLLSSILNPAPAQ